MKSILLKFSGPLQAWGTSSHYDTRHTDRLPSKSGVIGLLAASFGFSRSQDEEMNQFNSLDFAVRVDQEGILLKDYQTAKSYTPNGEKVLSAYVTNRYYLSDAIFLVAIGASDEKWIAEVAQMLHSPYYSPFLGRRSAPPTADYLYGTSEYGVIDALRNTPWLALPWYQKRHPEIHSLEIYADAGLVSAENVSMRRDRVRSFSQKNRQFGFRAEGRILMPLPGRKYPVSTEHDAFDAIGE